MPPPTRNEKGVGGGEWVGGCGTTPACRYRPAGGVEFISEMFGCYCQHRQGHTVRVRIRFFSVCGSRLSNRCAFGLETLIGS